MQVMHSVRSPATACMHCRHLHRRCAGTCTGGVHTDCASERNPVLLQFGSDLKRESLGLIGPGQVFFVGQMHFVLPNHLVLKHRGKLKALSFMCAAYMYVHMNSVCAMDVTEFECESECCQILTIFCKSEI